MTMLHEKSTKLKVLKWITFKPLDLCWLIICFGVETSAATTRALPEAGSAEGAGQGETAAEGTQTGRRHFVQIAPIQQNATAIHIPLYWKGWLPASACNFCAMLL